MLSSDSHTNMNSTNNNSNNSSTSSSPLPYNTCGGSSSSNGIVNNRSKLSDTQFNSTDLQIGEGESADDEPPNRLTYKTKTSSPLIFLPPHPSSDPYSNYHPYNHTSSSTPTTPKLHNGINGHTSHNSSPVTGTGYRRLNDMDMDITSSMLYVDTNIKCLRKNSNDIHMNGLMSHSNGTSDTDADGDAEHLYHTDSLASTTSVSSLASLSPPPTSGAALTENHSNVASQSLSSSSSSLLGYNPSQRFDDNVAVQFNSHAAVSYVSPKLEARTGIFCVAPISKDETLIVWTGKIVSAEQALFIMDTDDKHYILQIADGFYQIPLSSHREPADWTNHSCAPTAGFGKNSPILLSAMRDMNVGDEVLFDYGMCETDERLWEPMECQCGASTCRGLITANDWKREELWDRYEGYWSPHVQKLVNQIRSKTREERLSLLLQTQQQQQEELVNSVELDKQSQTQTNVSYALEASKIRKRKPRQIQLENEAMGDMENGDISSPSSSSSSSSSISFSSSPSPSPPLSDSGSDTRHVPFSEWLQCASTVFDRVLLWFGIVRVKRLAELYGSHTFTSMHHKYTTG